jgi:hypothetical protein
VEGGERGEGRELSLAVLVVLPVRSSRQSCVEVAWWLVVSGSAQVIFLFGAAV